METDELLELIKKPGMYSDFYISSVSFRLAGKPDRQGLYKRTFAAVEVDWDFITYLTKEQTETLLAAGVERWK